MASIKLIFLLGLAAVSAFPAKDQIFSKWGSDDLRFSYLEDDQGNAHLVDNWVKVGDLERMARYRPNYSNLYHLFTRANPTTSQILQLHNTQNLLASNFHPKKRTIVIMHGFLGSATSDVNTVLVPAYLAAEDLNVIVLNWSSGAIWGPNAGASGEAAGGFINWVISVVGGHANLYQTVGFSVGGHGAAIMARHVNGVVQAVIGLDPADRWSAATAFRADDALYTEIIHTSTLGEQDAVAQVDFYPNGGRSQPGCLTSICEHDRSFHFLGESLRSGGFTGRRCDTVAQAHAQNCNGSETLQMGGLNPKVGRSGIYHFRTNRAPPFSQG